MYTKKLLELHVVALFLKYKSHCAAQVGLVLRPSASQEGEIIVCDTVPTSY